MAMRYMKRAEDGMWTGGGTEAGRVWFESNMGYAIKLLRLHNETVETLGRYKRGGEQRVNVTHSVIASQAIVNFGEGVRGKTTGGSTCSPGNAALGPEQMAINHADNQQWPMAGADCMEAKVPARKQKRVKGV